MTLKKFGIVLSIFLFNGVLFAQQDNPQVYDRSKHVLNEAFILITVTSDRGNAFYRVMTDDQERPYLNIKDFMEQYVDFTSVKCDPDSKHCQGTMQPKQNIYWVDGKHSSYGDYDQGTADQKIPEGAFVVQDGVCWLRYDVWQKWLPLTATWDIRSYYLSIIPNFQLLSDRKKLREREVELAEETKRERELIDKTDAITPESGFRPELKYHASLREFPRQQVGGDFNYDANVDVFRGTFQTGGPVSYDKGPGVSATRPYWVYRLQDQKYFYLMEVGDTYFEESGLLLPNISGSNGFKYDSRQMVYGSGKITVNGRAQQNTVVDLYRDGMYMGTVRVGSDGRYIFNDIVVSSYSRLVAKLYFPDGSEEMRDIVLSDDNGMIIKRGEFQERVFSADTLYGRMNYMALRYGLLNNTTIGVHPMYFAGSEQASGMADIAMRPFADTVLLGQGLFTGKNIDRAFRVNTTLLYPNYLEVEHRFYNDNTPSFLKNMRTTGEYWAGRHSVGIGRLQFINQYEQYKEMRDASAEVIYSYNRYLKPFFSYGAFFPTGVAWYNQVKAGFDIMATDHSVLEISRTWTQPVAINTISFFVRSIIYVGGWDVGITWNIPDRLIKSNLLADIMYRITKNLSLGVLSNDKYLGFRINWDGIISPTPGPPTWSEYAMGTLSGDVVSPKNQEGQTFPVENATITVGTKTANTDKNGHFEVSGIAPYQKLTAKVEPASLDASMAPEKDFDVVYFRPGTEINWSPNILWTTGIDGTISGIDSIPPGLVIEAMKMPGNRIVSKGIVESDGFFIVEKLTPGHYQLKLKGLKEDAKPMEVDIPEASNWIAGIKYDLGAVPAMTATKVAAEKTVAAKAAPKKKVKAAEPSEQKKYYATDGGPMFVTEVQKGKGRGLDGFISSNKKLPQDLFVEVVRLKDNKIIDKVQVIRDGAFVVEALDVGKYELRLIGSENPPKPLKVEMDSDVNWLSGIVWNWQQ